MTDAPNPAPRVDLEAPQENRYESMIGLLIIMTPGWPGPEGDDKLPQNLLSEGDNDA